jgi:carboxyl-terminal processing protease
VAWQVKRSRAFYIWLFAFCATMIIVLVVSGVSLGIGLRHGGSGSSTALAGLAQVIPGVLQVTSDSKIPAATDLQPLATFWEVRDKLLRDYVKPVDDETKLTYGAIRGMLQALNDPYTRFMTPEEYREFHDETEGKFEGIGVSLVPTKQEADAQGPPDVVIMSVMPEGPAAEKGVRAGDIIYKVGGQSARGKTLQEVRDMIKGPTGESVTLTLKREGQADLVEITVVRRPVDIPVVESEMLDGKVGYVRLNTFNRQAELKVREALQSLLDQKMKGLILDLSLNGGGLLPMAVSVAGLFVESQPVVYVQERGQEPQPYECKGRPLVPEGIPMVVLVDHGSASASEIVAGCLQDLGRAKVVGFNSYGKATVQTVCELNDGSALVLTTAHYLTPHKRDISAADAEGKRGLKPDIAFPEPDPKNPPTADAWHKQIVSRAQQVVTQQIAAAGQSGHG